MVKFLWMLTQFSKNVEPLKTCMLYYGKEDQIHRGCKFRGLIHVLEKMNF